MVNTIKFSEMTAGGDIANDDKTPGLLSGSNVLFNNPWTFLPPGTTADRPAPSAAINYRLRFNTDDQLYEYYDAILMQWTQLQESFFTAGPFVIYEDSTALPDAFNLGSLTTGILKQTVVLGVSTPAIALVDTDYYGPGMVGYLQQPAGVKDVNGNIILDFGHAASAVNYINISNNITGNAPFLNSLGSDPSIGMAFGAKGDAGFNFVSSAVVLPPFAISSGTSSQHVTNFLFSNTAATRNVTFQDASGTVAFLSDVPSVTPSALTKTDDTNVTLTLGGTPSTALLQAVSLTLGWTGILSIPRGGTGVSTVTSVPVASAWAGWDQNLNMLANNFAPKFQSIVTSGATTTLLVTSPYTTQFTGSSTQTLIMPNVGVIAITGLYYSIINQSSGAVTVQSSGGNTIQVMAANTSLLLCNNAVSGTDASVWSVVRYITSVTSFPLSLALGGTNNSLTASAGGILWSDASKLNILSGTATANQLLLSGNAATPTWSTSTYPSTNAANTLLYASSANTMAALATQNSSVLITSAGGVPSLSTTLPSGIAATNMNLTTPTLGVASATSISFGGTALANYVEGTWTPTLVGSGGGSATYATNVGSYTRIGNRVFFEAYISITASTLAGNITISGLPLTAAAAIFSACSVFANQFGATATPTITAYVQASNTIINLWVYSAGTATALTATNLGTLAILLVTGCYHV